MTDKQFYTCDYCFKDFEPKRRRVQKYCSNTCRSKAYHARKEKSTLALHGSKDIVPDIPPFPKPKMTVAGVGNAAVGALAADTLKNLMTPKSNKAATKGDLDQLLEKLNGRYHLVKNMQPNALVQYPYFDLIDGVLVYFKTT